jgi:hypothetical protein
MYPAHFAQGTLRNNLALTTSADPSNGWHRGNLRTTGNRAVQLERVWGIAFGPGVQNHPTDTLFAAARINDEDGGLYARIDALSEDN